METSGTPENAVPRNPNDGSLISVFPEGERRSSSPSNPLGFAAQSLDGDHFRWRFEAKVVAYLNLAVVYFCGVTIFLSTIFLSCVTIQLKRGYLHQDIRDMLPGLNPDNENAFLCLGYSLLLLAAVVTGFDLWAARNLHKAATKPVQSHHETLKLCTKWRNGNIFLLATVFMGLGLGFPLCPLLIWIAIRVLCLLFVGLHIQELRLESQKLRETKQKYRVTTDEILSQDPKLSTLD